ncbi:MAG: hypothetical protein MI923_16170 [Phycisphaerales bacterium]|nr:hypothetical protein [Phycisphaerales bacterium]
MTTGTTSSSRARNVGDPCASQQHMLARQRHALFVKRRLVFRIMSDRAGG